MITEDDRVIVEMSQWLYQYISYILISKEIDKGVYDLLEEYENNGKI